MAKKPFTLDSQWIVPYNKFTAWKYNAHLNLEAVENVSALKYLFKYVAKGTDKAVFKIVPDENEPEQVYDQIRNWLTGRYLSSMEASYRILAFPISQLDPSVKRLDFHLPGQQSVSYNPNEDKAKVLKRASQTMLTEWFTLNQNDEIARNFTYREIILFYTWVSTKSNCKWKKRVQGTLDSFNFNLKRGNQIGYLPTVLPSGPNGVEKLALYLLLLQATGAKSFEDLRTIDGIIYRTFKDAAVFKNLMERDNEIEFVLNEVFISLFGKPLRRFFAYLLANWSPDNPKELWEKFKDKLCEDFTRMESKKLNPNKYTMQEMYDKALKSINFYLEQLNKSLTDVGLPLPSDLDLETGNQLFSEIKDDLTVSDIAKSIESLNNDQKNVYENILAAVNDSNTDKRLFFIDAPGGTGKTYMLNKIIEKLTFDGKNVCATASSGVSAILLNGGGTIHSKFRLPQEIDEDTPCDITRQSKRAKEIRNMDVLIWDEAPMFSKYLLESVNRCLQDIRKTEKLFGGVTVILSGDWRQILPVVKIGNRRAGSIDMSHKFSELWYNFTVLKLTENMRVDPNNPDSVWFKQFLLDVGEGKLNMKDQYGILEDIPLPDRFILKSNRIDHLIDVIFPELDYNIGNSNYADWISERGIIAPQNDIVNLINQMCLDRLPGQQVSLYAWDQNEADKEGTIEPMPIDSLHRIDEGGLPPYELKLKIGAPVTLLRNLTPKEGHCNGTRYIVTKINRGSLELKVISGPNKGDMYSVPKIPLKNSNNKHVISFSRKQFPVKLSFAFTSNKAQGQIFNHVGVCLSKSDFFTHGQFYVALSRATNPDQLHILLKDPNIKTAQNIVYDEILF